MRDEQRKESRLLAAADGTVCLPSSASSSPRTRNSTRRPTLPIYRRETARSRRSAGGRDPPLTPPHRAEIRRKRRLDNDPAPPQLALAAALCTLAAAPAALAHQTPSNSLTTEPWTPMVDESRLDAPFSQPVADYAATQTWLQNRP